MTTTQPPITEQDLNQLKSKIEAAKRQVEYDQLKRDLVDLTYKAANTPTEFDGAMQLSDTDHVIQTQRKSVHVVEMMFHRIQRMFSLKPIIGNIIALLIAAIVLFMIFNNMNKTGFNAVQHYLAIGIQIFAAIQIIKSATRGLLLPCLALVIGAVVAHSLGAHQTFLHFNKTFYNDLMITGIIGLGVAVVAID